MMEIVQLQMRDYEVLVHVQGSIGLPSVLVGEPGRCRFCGTTAARDFRNVAHTLPEALGNKWVTSVDECDSCNSSFSRFDDALAKSLGAVLTVGGTRGKNNKVRQTGRTGGPASIRHTVIDGRRSLSMRINGTPFGESFEVNRRTGELIFRVPGGAERFVPALAYRALVKMAVSLLPAVELPQFTRVIEWLGRPDDVLLPNMIVGISFANLGNAPPLLAAALLRRKMANPAMPYMAFVTTMGSVCLQTVLKADDRDGPWPSNRDARSNIKWTNVVTGEGEDILEFAYGPPTHLDWGRALLELPAVEAIVTAVNPRTNEGRMTAILRDSALAAARPRT